MKLRSFVAAVLAGSITVPATLVGQGFALEPGDILTANYYANKVVRVNPVTGAQLSLGSFPAPMDLALSPEGNLYIGELGGKIKRLTLTNGVVTVLPTAWLTSVRGLTLGPGGDLFVTGRSNTVDVVMRVNPATGQETLITSRGNLSMPTGIEMLDAENLVVASFFNSRIVRVRISDGTQTVIASGGVWLDRPWGLAVSGDSIYAGHYDSKHINRISASTGTSELLAIAPGVPYGMGLDLGGNILVGAAGNVGQQDMLARFSPAGVPMGNFSVGLSQQISGIEVSPVQIVPPAGNAAPVIQPIGNKSVSELTTLAFSVTATDADVPAQALAFSLEPGAPAGASISAAGDFSWTPGEAQGPGSYTITVRVTDDGVPAASSTATFNVSVQEVNSAPSMNPVAPQSFTEGSLATLQVTAADGDLPAQTLTFSMAPGNPAGAAITQAGLFSWTPSEAQGAGSYIISIVATDNGSPPLSTTNQFEASVAEVNTAPQITPIPDKAVDAGTLLTFTAQATDPDLPAQTLQFSLDPGAPSGAAITPAGLFTWTPTAGQAPGTSTLTVRVVDNGSPALSATASFNVTVTVANLPPVPSSPTVDWAATCGLKLRVQDLLGTDPDGDSLNLVSIDPVSKQGGAVTVVEGWVSFSPPAAGLTGPDTIGYTVGDGKGGLGAGTVTIVPTGNTAASLNVNWGVTQGGAVRITGSGIPLRTYAVEYTESLSAPAWQALGNVIADAAGLFEYLDTPATGSPARFYRTSSTCP